MLTQSCRKSSTKHCYLLMCNRISLKKIDKHQAVSKLLSTSEWEPIFNIHKQCKTFISFKKTKTYVRFKSCNRHMCSTSYICAGGEKCFLFLFFVQNTDHNGVQRMGGLSFQLYFMFSLFFCFLNCFIFFLSFFFQLLYMHALLLNCLYWDPTLWVVTFLFACGGVLFCSKM